MSNRKKYIPSSTVNPIVQAHKLDKIRQTLADQSVKIDQFDQTLKAVSKSFEDHISHLGNFARHDIKNAILSMDSILTVYDPAEFDEGKIQSLATYLNVIRETIDNFAKLVPYSSDGKFKLENLIVSTELLSRADMSKNKIDLRLVFERESSKEIDLPFQATLQIINNLLINSIKALESVSEEKIIILDAKIIENKLVIKISDNGIIIPDQNKNLIFTYGFSTTQGSGIGLYHAKYFCDLFKGSIELMENCEDNMTKTFTITIPIE